MALCCNSSGSWVPNTGKILVELSRRRTETVYFAHDICEEQLRNSLQKLSTSLSESTEPSTVKLHGLVGTYEDSIAWLRLQKNFEGRNLITIWLGNSLANLSDLAFADLISRFTRALSKTNAKSSRLIISVDGCKDAKVVQDAYDVADGTSCAFISNGLQQANRVLGKKVFLEDQWAPVSFYDEAEDRIIWGYRSNEQRNIKPIKGKITIDAGEMIQIIQSKKRIQDDVIRCIAGTCSEVDLVWQHPSMSWSRFLLSVSWWYERLTFSRLVHLSSFRRLRRHSTIIVADVYRTFAETIP